MKSYKSRPMLERLKTLDDRTSKQDSFMNFLYMSGLSLLRAVTIRFTLKSCKLLLMVSQRLIVNMPLDIRSRSLRVICPTWLMGRRPDLKIIQATHTAELAVGFGRKVKNLIDSDEFRDVFLTSTWHQMRRRVVVEYERRWRILCGWCWWRVG